MSLVKKAQGDFNDGNHEISLNDTSWFGAGDNKPQN